MSDLFIDAVGVSGGPWGASCASNRSQQMTMIIAASSRNLNLNAALSLNPRSMARVRHRSQYGRLASRQ